MIFMGSDLILVQSIVESTVGSIDPIIALKIKEKID